MLSVAAALVTGACTPEPIDPAPGSLAALTSPDRECPAQQAGEVVPTGALRVGYPEEPVAYLPALAGDDAAALDLAAIWGLPLFDLDAAGQLRPRLVREAIVLGSGNGGWQVRLILCQGLWSDGLPVVADDVAATIDALRAIAPDLTGAVTDAVVDGPDVIVTFESSSGRWQHALADLGPMLPAHVLADQGIEAFRQGIPVAGGAFALVDEEPGRSRSFAANPDSVLGPPRSASLELLVVPRFELALGLLVQDDLDVALGHLALEAGARIDDLDGIDGVAARGGTQLTWQWQPGSVVQDPSTRIQVAAAFNLEPFAEALLEGQGGVSGSFVAGATGPEARTRARLDDVPELTVASPRWSESAGLVARAVRDGVERMGGTMRTASEESDVLLQSPLGDGHIIVRRLSPWPSLRWLARTAEVADPSALRAADLAVARGSAAVAAGLVAFDALAIEVPLVELPVAHAWRVEVAGVDASGWPGIGFTSVTQWVSGE